MRMSPRIRCSRPRSVFVRIIILLALVWLAWPYISGFAAVGYGYAWWAITPGPPELDLSKASNGTLVPKVIHQTWKEAAVPSKWQAAQQSCRDLHPDFEYRLWTDEESLAFIEREFPWFLPTYLSYPYPIQRVDAIRYFILYRYGGIYLDLDVGCRQRLDGLLGSRFVAPLTMPLGISNDVMAAAPGCIYLSRCIRNLRGWNLWMMLQYVQVMFSTGPMFLTIQLALSSVPERAGLVAISAADYGKYGGQDGNPLFYHLHGSSWHAGDAPFFLWMLRFGKHVAVVAALCLVAALGCWYWRRTSNSSLADKHDADNIPLIVRSSSLSDNGKAGILRQKSQTCDSV